MQDEQRKIELCKRIHAYCEQQQWYGPDGCKGVYEERMHRGYYDAEGNLHVQPVDAALLHRIFEFPPATDEQIRATEEALGIPLPPMLRLLYTQVANGGFGPAYGITGARDGYYFGEDGCYETIDQCTNSDPSIQYIDLETYERTLDDPTYFELPYHVKPAFLLDLCYQGCGSASCIDGKRGRVYYIYAVGEMIEDGDWEGTVGYRLEAESLEDWLDTWLEGEQSSGLENRHRLPF